MSYQSNQRMISVKQKAVTWIQAALVALFISTNLNIVWAAPPTLTETEELNRRARQEAMDRKQREQERDIFLQEQSGDKVDEISLPEEELSFDIHTLRLEGAHIKSFPWAQVLLDRYVGQRIGQQGINIIVKNVTKGFVNHGYITTRVIVPEQDLSTGTLRLTLIPCIIHDIRIKNLDDIRINDPDYVGNWKTAFPVRPGDLLNLRDLEQGLEQMKRVPSQDVDMQLLPGAQPGETDILITVKESRPYKISFSVDDSGSKATGRLQSSATFSRDNILGLNDLFNVSFNQDAERESNILGTRGNSLYSQCLMATGPIP